MCAERPVQSGSGTEVSCTYMNGERQVSHLPDARDGNAWRVAARRGMGRGLRRRREAICFR